MLGGIFVGGAGRRMGGAPKGLLRSGGETLVARVARALREAGVEPVLVGDREEYGGLLVRRIRDAKSSSGPLGGLVALLEAAGGEPVIAVACDMPYVTVDLVRKLASAPDAAVVAPRREGRWEPLFARYDPARVLAVARARCEAGELALQGLLDQVGAAALDLTPDEASRLADWDTPDDVAGADASLAGRTAAREVVVFRASGREARADRVAVEEPLEIRSAGRSVSVTMRTPGHDVDLAVGFLVGEGVVRARGDVVSASQQGEHVVVVDLAPDARARLPQAARSFLATSSCGLCGKASLDQVRAAIPPWPRGATRIDARAVFAIPEALRAAQSIFERTGGLHAAGLFRLAAPDAPELVRAAEDVGRHNAVDKVIGAEYLAGRLPLAGHVLALSGRSAFELVQKAALAGAPILVAVGAPTSLAVELAETAGITLVGFARDGRFNVYAGADRVVGAS